MRKTFDFKNFSIDLICEWIQFKDVSLWNWLSLHLINLYFEQDRRYGMYEFEAYLLGFGIRIYFSYTNPEIEKRFKKIAKMIKKVGVIEKNG
jgi:hypothetical protein